MNKTYLLIILVLSILLASCSAPTKEENENGSSIADKRAALKAERDKQIDHFKSQITTATSDYLSINEAGWQIAGWSTLLDKELKDAFKPGIFDRITEESIRQGMERIRTYPIIIGIVITSGSSRRSLDLVARAFADSKGASYWRIEPLTPELRELIKTLNPSQVDPN